jgi:uncharacterized membrane protein
MGTPLNAAAPAFAEVSRAELLSNPVFGLAESLSLIVGAVGVAVILWGAYSTAVRLIGSQFAPTRRLSPMAWPETVCQQLSSHLLLGLDFLTGAGLIRALVAPDWLNVAVLGGIVLIRTVTSFSRRWEVARSTGLQELEVAAGCSPAAREESEGWPLPESADEVPVQAGR